MRSSLPLHEEVLLLALRDEEGTLHSGAWIQNALGGAVLGELLLSGRIRSVEEDGESVVEVADGSSAGDEVLDDAVGRIRGERKLRAASHWVGAFSANSDTLRRTAESLCRKKILRTDERKVLLLFTRKCYPEVDPRPEAELIERIRKAVFEDGPIDDPRTVVLVNVASKTGLLKANFEKGDLERRKERIEAIAKGDFAGDATGEAIEAAQQAFFFLVVMPAIMTTIIT